METKTQQADMENPKLNAQNTSAEGPTVGLFSTNFVEAAALLTIWSVLVINEGAIRVLASNPGDGFMDGRPHTVVIFLAGVAEVVFGMIGLFVGMASFIFRWYNTTITLMSMIAQTVLGYFVFIVFVFVLPGFQASDLEASRFPDFSLGQDRFLIALGVLTSFNFCLALQGGQFVFFCRLICAATGRDFLKQNSGNRMRAVFWNANLGLAGVWTLITGALVIANVGGGTLNGPIPSPPNVVIFPAMTLITGIVLILFASLGIFLAISGLGMSWVYYLLGGMVYLLSYMNYGVVQLAAAQGDGRNLGGPIALHGGLVYMVVFLGPYFVYQASKERATTSTE